MDRRTLLGSMLYAVAGFFASREVAAAVEPADPFPWTLEFSGKGMQKVKDDFVSQGYVYLCEPGTVVAVKYRGNTLCVVPMAMPHMEMCYAADYFESLQKLLKDWTVDSLEYAYRSDGWVYRHVNLLAALAVAGKTMASWPHADAVAFRSDPLGALIVDYAARQR